MIGLAAPVRDPAVAGPLLRREGLTRPLGDRVAVEGVSLSAAAGDVYGLPGPNGAGTTPTIELVCGLTAPDRGTVHVAGEQATSARARRLVGYVPKDVALCPDLTASENLRFLGSLYGLSGGVLHERVAEALELTDLTDRARERVGSYSGGMKRRLDMAARLLHHPGPLVLDEPTVRVDPQSRFAMLERVRTFAGQGMVVPCTTHYMEEADRICDRARRDPPLARDGAVGRRVRRARRRSRSDRAPS